MSYIWLQTVLAIGIQTKFFARATRENARRCW
jgi:hypothetical protein